MEQHLVFLNKKERDYIFCAILTALCIDGAKVRPDGMTADEEADLWSKLGAVDGSSNMMLYRNRMIGDENTEDKARH